MKAMLTILTVVLAIAASGCESSAPSDVPEPDVPEPDVTELDLSKPDIVNWLGSGSRTYTYIAIWTLRKNGFNPPKIDFGKPYVEAEAELEQLIAELSLLPVSKLSELNKSLEYNSSIYSPIWPHGEHGWKL